MVAEPLAQIAITEHTNSAQPLLNFDMIHLSVGLRIAVRLYELQLGDCAGRDVGMT